MATSEQIAADNLNWTKQQAGQSLIMYMNGVTANLLGRYPIAEVYSWTIQRAEAAALDAAGAGATAAMAPLISQVCQFHYGDADTATRLTQVLAKAAVVRANADAWQVVAAFVNGCRARYEDQLAAATTVDQVLALIQAAQDEANEFRAQAGI